MGGTPPRRTSPPRVETTLPKSIPSTSQSRSQTGGVPVPLPSRGYTHVQMTAAGAIARQEQPRRRPAVRISYASFESRVAAGALDVLVLFIIASLLVSAGSLVVLISSDFEKVDPSGTSINIFWACAGS